jgi:O-antigen/teichoic acid export membrane protein
MSGPTTPAIPGHDQAPELVVAEKGSAVPSLKSLAIKGSTWTLVEYGGSQVLRFVSSLILSRLLFPDVFGLMLMVNAVMQGLEMFSDLGIGQSIIQDKRGESQRFLNTAWTLQVMRGGVLFAAATLFAWPITLVYSDMPELRYLIPVTALSTLLSGFNSTNLHLLNRRLDLSRLTVINLGSQIAAFIFTIACASVWHSVWALVGAHLIAATLRLAASHTMCPGPRSRVVWDSDAAMSMFRFGRWIFLSTVFGFVALRGDQFILGYFETAAFLGVYSYALFLNQGTVQALHTISARVLFPVFSRLAEEGPERLRSQMNRMRTVLMVLSVPPVCILAVFGSDIVTLLYPDSFQDAGWMLEILAAGAVASVIGSTIGPVLLAVGNSFAFMMQMALRTVVLLTAMAIGGWYYGTVGLIVGIAIPDIVIYPVLVLLVRRYGVWHPRLDFAGFVCAYAFIGIGWILWP